MEFSPDEMLTFTAVDMCAGWIGAALLLVVGFVSVRTAHKTSGLMVGGAGALLLVTGCCAYWEAFYARAIGYIEPPLDTLGSLSFAVGFFARLGGWVLVVVGAVMLARQMKASGGAG